MSDEHEARLVTEEAAASCSDLTVLLQQDHSSIIDLKLAVIP